MGSRRESSMRGRVHRALIVCVAAAASLAACHSTPKAEIPTADAAPLAMRAFGDTAAYGMQVLKLDRQKEVATVALRSPAELIVLSVIPGREIELIVPGEVANAGHTSFKQGVSSIQMARWEHSVRPANADHDAQAAMEYNRCISRAQAAARAAAQKRRPVKRDSTGKIIDDGRSGDPSVNEFQLERAYEAACSNQDKSYLNKPAPPVRMPPRPAADRYLVVLASSTPLTAVQLGERLAGLTAVGSDVSTTIEAIAAGLYAGLPGTWSGGYVAW